jgi:hypothetical protein
VNETSKPIGRESKKKAQRDALIQAMLQQPSLQRAAQMAGISEPTAWRIRQTAEFQEEFRQIRHDGVRHSFGRLQHASAAAVQIVLKIMVDEKSPPSSRLQAAKSVLEFAKGSLESEGVEVRVRELEDIVKSNGLLGGAPAPAAEAAKSGAL